MSKQEYIERNRQWLRDMAVKPGVKELDKGVLYRVIHKGRDEGPTPNRNSVVIVHYTGKIINGRTFDSSLGGTPPALRLRELIPGWMIVLTKMRKGDKWEIYMPSLSPEYQVVQH